MQGAKYNLEPTPEVPKHLQCTGVTCPGPNGPDRPLSRADALAGFEAAPKGTLEQRLWNGTLSHINGGGSAAVHNGWIKTWWPEDVT